VFKSVAILCSVDRQNIPAFQRSLVIPVLVPDSQTLYCDSSTLKMVTLNSSKMSENIYESTRYNVIEDYIFSNAVKI
jgi:hypothetical protein